jgi:hypothetical protein
MDDLSHKNVHAYLQQSHRDLKAIFDKIKLLDGLDQKIKAHLDPGMAPYCQAANLVNNTLVLIIANGAIATHLRFLTQDLLKKFSQDPALRHIQHIQCKVRPASPTGPVWAASPAENMALLSQETGQIVGQMAQSIADPKIREIMLRIAGRVRTR